MKIKKINHKLNTNNRQRLNRKKGFGNNSQIRLETQKQSYETSGSLGINNKKVSVPLRNVYLSKNISKVSKSPYAIISFGGKNPKHQVFVGAEMPPYCKIGGVATVMEDYKKMFDNDKDNRKVMVIPYYNGKIVCDKSGKPTGKAVVHTFPEGTKDKTGNDISGQPFYTGEDLTKNKISDVIKDGKYHILEKVGEDDTMSFGLNQDEKIGLYRVKDTSHYMVFTEATALMPKPYETAKLNGVGGYGSSVGGYSSNGGSSGFAWNGDPYAKFDKAVVELLPKIQNTYSQDGKTQESTKFEPQTVICSDSQTAYIPHYMAISDKEYYNDMHPTYVAHNLGQGYCAETSYKNMYINLGATKEDIEKIQNDEKYKEACLQGNEEGYFKELLKDAPVADAVGTVNAVMVPIHYTKEGYIPVLTTVSEDYAEALTTNETISPGLYKDLKSMYEKGQFHGILNALNNFGDPEKRQGLEGYGYNIYEAQDSSGKQTFITSKDLALKALEDDETYKNGDKDTKNKLLENKAQEFEKAGKILSDMFGYTNIKLFSEALTTYSKDADKNWEAIKKAKADNKRKIIERFQTDGNDNGFLLTGNKGKSAKQLGYLDINKITEGLTEGTTNEKLEKCHLTVSWGRVDLQKGLDETMQAWAKYAKHDKNAFLIIGGGLPETDNDESKRIKSSIDNLSKEFAGRFVFMDGFVPGNALSAAADVASFPSRFAPCELTDLETMHYGVTPVVTNCQGLKQKNFDPELGDKEPQTSLKTLHEFFMSQDALINYDDEMQKAIDWLDSKKGTFTGFLEGSKDKGFNYKEDIDIEAIFNGRNAILTAYDNDKGIKTDDDKQKDTTRQLLRASFEFQTSGFKKGYQKLKDDTISKAKNQANVDKLGEEYEKELLDNITKSKDYNDLMRNSRDFIINSEMAMGLIRSKYLIANNATKKELFQNAISLNTLLDGNTRLHPQWKEFSTQLSTQELYRKAHIERISKKPEKILKINTPNIKDSTKNNLSNKIKNWWTNLSKTGKWSIGVGAGVATAAAIGGGIYAGVKANMKKQEAAIQNPKDFDIDNHEYLDEGIDIKE